MIFSYRFFSNLLVVVYLSSALGYLVFFLTRKTGFKFWGFVLVWVGCSLHAGLIFYRSLIFQSLAVSSLYESLNFFAWLIIIVFLFFEIRQRDRVDGVFVLPLVVSLVGYAAVVGSDIEPMPAVLKSPWLGVHVSFCFLSYACFTLALVFAIMYLWQEKELKSRKVDVFFFRLPALGALDQQGYRIIFLGFISLSLGIVSGSVWAQQAWGAFWSWDPKETGSLALWLLYLIYLHSRLMSGWRGRKSAYLAIIGFLAMLFIFLGVSLFIPGLHSYLQ